MGNDERCETDKFFKDWAGPWQMKMEDGYMGGNCAWSEKH
jgi:hypothetical protein